MGPVSSCCVASSSSPGHIASLHNITAGQGGAQLGLCCAKLCNACACSCAVQQAEASRVPAFRAITCLACCHTEAERLLTNRRVRHVHQVLDILLSPNHLPDHPSCSIRCLLKELDAHVQYLYVHTTGHDMRACERRKSASAMILSLNVTLAFYFTPGSAAAAAAAAAAVAAAVTISVHNPTEDPHFLVDCSLPKLRRKVAPPACSSATCQPAHEHPQLACSRDMQLLPGADPTRCWGQRCCRPDPHGATHCRQQCRTRLADIILHTGLSPLPAYSSVPAGQDQPSTHLQEVSQADAGHQMAQLQGVLRCSLFPIWGSSCCTISLRQVGRCLRLLSRLLGCLQMLSGVMQAPSGGMHAWVEG